MGTARVGTAPKCGVSCALGGDQYGIPFIPPNGGGCPFLSAQKGSDSKALGGPNIIMG
jgi:hypothetical protein